MKRLVFALLLACIAVDAFGAVRIRYTVRFNEVRKGSSRTVYKAVIEGGASTDFEVSLRDERVQMRIAFVNEILPAGALDTRVRIEQRRRFGTSPAKLPLWEEDSQERRFRVGMNEELELLPFGGPGRDGLLVATIVPELLPAASTSTPIAIRIENAAQSNVISVRAYNVPHWYDVTTSLERDGRVVANGSARIFAKEPAAISVGNTKVTVTAGPVPFDDAWRSTSIHFDAPFARGWEGVTRDAPLAFRIDANTVFRIAAKPIR